MISFLQILLSYYFLVAFVNIIDIQRVYRITKVRRNLGRFSAVQSGTPSIGGVGKNALRPAQVNKKILAKLKQKKKAYGVQKKGQVTRKEHRDIVQVAKDHVKKAKAHILLKACCLHSLCLTALIPTRICPPLFFLPVICLISLSLLCICKP